MATAKQIEWKGLEIIELRAGGYVAWIAPSIGSNVIRMRDEAHGIEFFRFDENNTPEDIMASPEVWGLPTLYLPNRFADGVLKTSDAVYHLPVNEKAPYNNHIHGFLHKRAHTVTGYVGGKNEAWVRTAYVYDENDPFFEYLPLPFTVEFFFDLSEVGLEYRCSMINQSQKMLPISLATHTTIAAPFLDGGKPENIRLMAEVKDRWILNDRCLPTGEIRALSAYDREYCEGMICPVGHVIDNEMYTGGRIELASRPRPYRGVLMLDETAALGIGIEVSENYKFWIFWNDRGEKGYFCPEPMTAMIDAPNLDMPAEKTGYQEIGSGQQFHVAQRYFTIDAQ